MITKQQRQEIVSDFAARNGGVFTPRLFWQEVKKSGNNHPAWEWFDDWDALTAAENWWDERARQFAQGLRISVKMEVIERGAVVVRYAEAPLVLSPLDERQHGGGYYVIDANNPDHLAEMCCQGAAHFQWALDRYEVALRHVGASIPHLRHIIGQLENACRKNVEAAE